MGIYRKNKKFNLSVVCLCFNTTVEFFLSNNFNQITDLQRHQLWFSVEKCLASSLMCWFELSPSLSTCQLSQFPAWPQISCSTNVDPLCCERAVLTAGQVVSCHAIAAGWRGKWRMQVCRLVKCGLGLELHFYFQLIGCH